jgi:hypothetical protein
MSQTEARPSAFDSYEPAMMHLAMQQKHSAL